MHKKCANRNQTIVKEDKNNIISFKNRNLEPVWKSVFVTELSYPHNDSYVIILVFFLLNEKKFAQALTDSHFYYDSIPQW